jgi:hypothetical protein
MFDFVFKLASWHLFLLGILTGTTFYTTFVSGIIQFRNLPRHVFGALQARQFPVYFMVQAVGSLALAYSSFVLFESKLENFTLTKPFSPADLNTVFFGLSFAASLFNYLYIGPKSTQIMFLRHKLNREKIDIPSELDRAFSIMHGVSAILNMMTLFACVYANFYLGHKLI